MLVHVRFQKGVCEYFGMTNSSSDNCTGVAGTIDNKALRTFDNDEEFGDIEKHQTIRKHQMYTLLKLLVETDILFKDSCMAGYWKIFGEHIIVEDEKATQSNKSKKNIELSAEEINMLDIVAVVAQSMKNAEERSIIRHMGWCEFQEVLVAELKVSQHTGDSGSITSKITQL